MKVFWSVIEGGPDDSYIWAFVLCKSFADKIDTFGCGVDIDQVQVFSLYASTHFFPWTFFLHTKRLTNLTKFTMKNRLCKDQLQRKWRRPKNSFDAVGIKQIYPHCYFKTIKLCPSLWKCSSSSLNCQVLQCVSFEKEKGASKKNVISKT